MNALLVRNAQKNLIIGKEDIIVEFADKFYAVLAVTRSYLEYYLAAVVTLRISISLIDYLSDLTVFSRKFEGLWILFLCALFSHRGIRNSF